MMRYMSVENENRTPRTGEELAGQIRRISQYALKRTRAQWGDDVDRCNAIADEGFISVSLNNDTDAHLVPWIDNDGSCSGVELNMRSRSVGVHSDSVLGAAMTGKSGVTRRVIVDTQDTTSLHYAEYVSDRGGDDFELPNTAWTDNDPEVVAAVAAKMLGQIRGALAAAELAKKEQERARQEQERARQEKEKAKRLKQLREILG